MIKQKSGFCVGGVMYTYQKVMIGLAVASFAATAIAVAFGVSIRLIDEIGGGLPG